MGTPYAGNPASYPLAVTIPSGSDTPNTTTFNTAYEGTLDRTAWLHAQLQPMIANNWCPEFDGVGGPTFSATVPLYDVAWSPGTGRGRGLWMATQCTSTITGASNVWISYGQDEGAEWTQVGGQITTTNPIYYASACASSITLGNYLFFGVDSASTLYGFAYVSGSWTQVYANSSVGTYYGVQTTTFNGYNIVAIAGSNSADPVLLSSNSEFSVSPYSYSVSVAMAVGSGWNLQANASMALAIPRSENFSTVYKTTDGITWVAYPNLSPLLPANSTIVGLAWGADAGGACWLACAQPASGLPVFFRSADGVTWTPQTGGVTSSGQSVVGLASIGGSLFVATIGDTGGGQSNLIFTIDGGVTWYDSQAVLTSSQTGGNGYIPAQVVASNCGFSFFNNKFIRFSLLAGLPPVSL